ncbi:MAG: ABC transporter permease subunit [Blastocatellia bacterium]|nr:ABC transporter permease subunit [Blastocatellia bacterium]
MQNIIVIAQNTFRESVRDKVLYNLLFFVILLIASSLLMAELSINQEQLIITRMGLSSMLFFGILIAIFIGTGLVYKEIDKRTIYAMLAKPVTRPEFLFGKFLGLSTTLFVNCSVMISAIVTALVLLNYRRTATLDIPWSILPAGFLIYLELLIMVAIALLFSSFSTPVLSTVFSVILYIIGSLSRDILLFANNISIASLKYILVGIYYLLPNLGNFNYINVIAHTENRIPIADIAYVSIYTVIYITILLIVTVTTFQKRNFK